MLFSDIEGSTRMVHALGDEWPRVLTRQREICRKAWADHGGHEMGTEGDSFFVVFEEAAEAVAAATAAQQALADASWPLDWPVRVRMGLHTGAPLRHEDGYVGLDLHRAARVAGVAHGGQVLLTEATRVRAGPASPAARAVDLGWHQLKDLPDPTHVFQLTGDGLATEFPPIRSRGAATNFPPLLNNTVGRVREIAELATLLTATETRLVTLTGPGGSGKTRLATAAVNELAHRFANGVYFVPLSTVNKGDEIWPEVARVLDIPDVLDAAGLLESVIDLEALVVLDNLEQVTDAAAMVTRLLAETRGMRVLATSRRPLHLDGEREYSVAPLLLPEASTFEAIQSSGAVQMFVDHARRARSGFELTPDNAEHVAALCRRLDGLPLAIELVAARVKVFSPAALVGRAGQALDLASPDTSKDRRQRTLRDAIAWSHSLLDAPGQRLLECLGVFVGGASLDALARVASAEDLEGRDELDLLFDLVDASLVRVADTDDGEPRFSLLETVAAFARDRLTDRGVIRDRRAAHAQYFYDQTCLRNAGIRTAAHARHRAVFVRELANLRAVLAAGASGVRHPEFYPGDVPASHVAVLVAGTAAEFAMPVEARALAVDALDAHDSDPYGDVALRMLLGGLLSDARDADAMAHIDAALRLSRDLPRVPLPSWVDPTPVEFRATRRQMFELHGRGSLDDARVLCRRLQVLAQAGPLDHEAMAQEAAAFQAYEEGDFEAAAHHLDLQREVLVRLEDERELVLWVNNRADAELRQGRHAQAALRLAAAVDDVLALGDLDVVLVHADTMASVIGHVDPLLCARTLGATEAARTALGLIRVGVEAHEAEVAPIRDLLTHQEWEGALREGASLDVSDQLRAMAERARTAYATATPP